MMESLEQWLATQLGIGSTDEVMGSVMIVALYGGALGMALYGVRRAHRALLAGVERWCEGRDVVRRQGAVFLSGKTLRYGAELALNIVRFAAVLCLLYLFVPLLLARIPATRSVAQQITELVLQALQNMGVAVIGYVPRLITVILILVVARWTIRAVRVFLKAVGAGEIVLGGFDPAWADQTYGLIRGMVILATVLIMYPHLPGASTTAFKGFSVFVGALVTFGASSATNNMFNGLILTYTGAFHVGDRVRVGNHEGDILKIGMISTHLRTLDNENVTIANTEVLKAEIVNYTAATASGGLKLRLAVDIAYHAEWRQVHQLLLQAAAATAGVRAAPAPQVHQSSLDPFAVTYTLVVAAEDPKRKLATLSALRENIQDGFNEAGIEIMTPSIRAVREALDSAMPERYLGPAAGR